MNAFRVLRENWIWWLVPLIVTFTLAMLLTRKTGPAEPVMPLTYDVLMAE